ncbi:MAG: glycoside hydrolase family 16 protein [Oscillospiraceae bacterium]|nr:glycoside hydrolase family 16 protein [Oscillospiraceae bacterium]
MLKKICAAIGVAVSSLCGTIGCLLYMIPREWSGREFPDVPRPSVEEAFASQEEALAAGGGWFVTMDEDFDGTEIPAPWSPSPHGKRNTEYWCSNMIDASAPGIVRVLAAELHDNVCDICPAEGDFTSGIETRGTFEQAFGYYEARVKYPEGPGLWSAFWLQAGTMAQLGSRGKDGSEIDIYESAFYYEPTKLGNCIHWDSYNAPFYKNHGTVVDTGINLYDGWHTHGLLWTPDSYTFFVDGRAVWKTNAGDVSRVPEFLRLTVEIRRQEYGPYGAKLGEFANTKENPSVFEIDYVRVYQHTDFLNRIKSPEDFRQLYVPKFIAGKYS